MSKETKLDTMLSSREVGKYGGLEAVLRGDRELKVNGNLLQEFTSESGISEVFLNGRMISSSYDEALVILMGAKGEKR